MNPAADPYHPYLARIYADVNVVYLFDSAAFEALYKVFHTDFAVRF